MSDMEVTNLIVKARWAVTRLRRLFELWDGKLDNIDKEFALRRIRDKEPALFYKIAQERPMSEQVCNGGWGEYERR